jgi:hypothetical protein
MMLSDNMFSYNIIVISNDIWQHDKMMLSDNILSDHLFFQPRAIMLPVSDNIDDNNNVIR